MLFFQHQSAWGFAPQALLLLRKRNRFQYCNKILEVKIMQHCHIYTDKNLIEYCEHTNKPLMDAEPEELKGLIYYDNNSKCPHCKNKIKVIPY